MYLTLFSLCRFLLLSTTLSDYTFFSERTAFSTTSSRLAYNEAAASLAVAGFQRHQDESCRCKVNPLCSPTL